MTTDTSTQPLTPEEAIRDLSMLISILNTKFHVVSSKTLTPYLDTLISLSRENRHLTETYMAKAIIYEHSLRDLIDKINEIKGFITSLIANPEKSSLVQVLNKIKDLEDISTTSEEPVVCICCSKVATPDLAGWAIVYEPGNFKRSYCPNHNSYTM